MSSDVILSDVLSSRKLHDEMLVGLKTRATELKEAGYMFYEFDGQNLSPELRLKAKQLHLFCTLLLVSSDGSSVDMLFNAEHARKLVAAGYTYEEFVEEVKKYDIPVKCNVVWDELAVAYRCYTCGLNPCMSMCTDCFEAGNHVGHDYNRFFSSSGGKCDCGDDDVVLESGFCNKHGQHNNASMDVPLELTIMPELMMQKVLFKLIEKFRGYSLRLNSVIENQNYSLFCHAEVVADKITNDVNPIIAFLDELTSLSAPFIDLMATILCNNEIYDKLKHYSSINYLPEESAITIEEMDQVNGKVAEFKEDVASLKKYEVPANLVSSVEFLPKEPMKFECLLDELMLYMVRTGFPQTLVNFLLKLLPNNEYKSRFASIFFGHYDEIEILLYQVAEERGKATDTHVPSKIVSRVVHISVQICSSKKICLVLESKVNILRRVLESCLRIIYDHALPLGLIQDNSSTPTWHALDMENNLFFDSYAYSGATTDLQNLFAHFDLLELVLTDPPISKEFVLLLASMEGMNALTRIVYGNHLERDVSHTQRSFTFEMEVSATFINQTLFNNYVYPEQTYYADFLVQKLREFFDQVFSKKVLRIFSGNYVTFHIPLHRQLASACIKYFVANRSLDLPDDSEFLRNLIAHPLRLQAVCWEFFAGLWVRNGSQINTNIILYLQPTFRNFLDNDLALIRIVTTKLPPWDITRLMADAFHLDDCFKYNCAEHDPELAPLNVVVFHKKWIPFMLDGYMKLLFEVVFIYSLAELSLETELRMQIVHVLSSNEKAPYSRIRQYFNYIQQIDEHQFERILNKVALFIKPDVVGSSNQQGHYVLKQECWTDQVDLIQAKYRAIGPREFNSIALHQEKALVKLIGNNRRPWPYYCLNDFQRDEVMFNKALHVFVQPCNVLVCRFILEWYIHGDFPIHLLQQAIYLLTSILRITTLPLIEDVEIEFTNYDNENKQSTTGLFKDKRLDYFEYFNQKPSRTLYLDASEAESILMLTLRLFYTKYSKEYPNSNKTQAAQAIEKMCNTELTKMDRVIGSGTDYVGRLIAWLYHSDPVSRRIIEKEVFSKAHESNTSESQKLMDKKMASKRRQLELLSQQKAKQSALMKKFANEEGLDDASRMDYEVSEDSTQIICSICNDNCNESERNSFGILIYSQTGSLTEDLITANTSDRVIGEVQMETVEQPTDGALLASYRDFETEAMPLFKHVYPDPLTVFSLLPYAELKSCAHYAHLSCYLNYRETVRADEYSTSALHALPCPLCRTNVTYILPLAAKLDPIDMETNPMNMKFDFDQFFSNRAYTQEIIYYHQGRYDDGRISPVDAANCYTLLKDQIQKMVGKREILAKQSLQASKSIRFGLNMIIPLSLIKNCVDRITEIEESGYEFPNRLKGILTEHLYFMASAECYDTDNFLESIWSQIWGDCVDGKPHLLHYDSQSILVICATASTKMDLPKGERIKMFRLCVKIALVHCYVRSLTISLLNRPNRSTILESLRTSHFSLSHVYKQTNECFVHENLLNRSNVWVNNNSSVEAVNERVQSNLIKFLKFAINLGVELHWITNVSKQLDLQFDTLLGFYSNAIFEQEVQLTQLIDFVQVSRIQQWVVNFLKVPDTLAVCYIDNTWRMKRLRRLPDSFDTLFKSYFGKTCMRCETVPNQPIICLVCGQLLCLESCCERDLPIDALNKITEVEAHANTCCSGSACFLSLSSTMVIIYHRRYISLFQSSPYLDKHFEEDRNLRRGKSLFLSKGRYDKLQELWMTHDFERNLNNSRAWLSIDSLGELLRQCHNFI